MKKLHKSGHELINNLKKVSQAHEFRLEFEFRK